MQKTSLICYNKSMKKLSLARHSSCLIQTRKGAPLYGYCTRIRNKAGRDLELIIKKKSSGTQFFNYQHCENG